MLTEIGLVIILAAWAYQFMMMLKGIDAASRAPQPLFAGLYLLGTALCIYEALQSGMYMFGYLNLAVFVAALGVFAQSFKR